MSGDPFLPWMLVDLGLLLYIVTEVGFMIRQEAEAEEDNFGKILLESARYVSSRQDSDDQAEHSSMCAICLEDFGEQVEVVVLPCKHVFHTGCMDEWLMKSSRCPLRCDAKVTLFTGIEQTSPLRER
mmetsp:Transcript_104573/g.294685  ORF Transcript_104573/g.294685 Transcript_104573/m.294685 type:complete len:127 (-) Transcript_104573:16-396(-)